MAVAWRFLFHSEFVSNQFYSARGEFRIGENSSPARQSYFYNCLAQCGPSIFLDSPTAFLTQCFATTKANKRLNMKLGS
jgi:hypothetical protein